jgi:rhodanese-related sulfurtransferase
MTDSLEIDGAQAAALLAGDPAPVLLDVREDYERAAGRIPGSLHIPLAELPQRAGELPPGSSVIVYCRAGMRSLMAAQALNAGGYQALSLAGGMLDWAAAERPLEPPGGTVADHGQPT